MEDFRYVKIITISIFTGILFIFPFFSLAYSDKTTHPALTNEIVKFFNIHYPELELNDEEKKLVVDGSVDEDAFGRWMQHYYDPVYNRGLVLLKKWQSSKKWAHDAKAQAGFVDSAFAGSLKAYFSGEDDYSWERAIYEYTWGDKEKGLSALGHILHLIEDITVPPHTRNDPHVVYLDEVFHDRSPYEHWTSKFDIKNIDIVKDLTNKRPIELNTLDEYFDTIASYTNRNFFSKDTIFHKEYSQPTVDFYTIEKLSNNLTTSFGYRTMNNYSYKILRLDKEFDWKKSINEDSDGNFFIIDDDDLILSDYWSLLSKQAVLNGAGVMKLFFDEVEKERETKTLAMKNRSLFQKAYDATAGKIFETSKALYGSSVTYEDLQGAVIQSQSQKESEPESENVVENLQENIIILESTTRTVLVGEEPVSVSEIEEEIIKQEATKIIEEPVVEQDSSYQQKLIPVNTPFFGGGGGGVKTKPVTENVPISSLSEYESPTATSTETSTSATTTSMIDTTPPGTPTLTITECSNSLSPNICLLISTTINLSYNSTSTDIFYYSIVKDDVVIATTTATTFSQTLLNGSYDIAIIAHDEAGNSATSSIKYVEISTMPIVINEIAWAGTASSTADEWIELYNRTNYTIDLSNIALLADDGVPYINLSGEVAGNSYYLIERSDDDATSIMADLTVAFSGIGGGSGLSNSGEVLSLIHFLGGQASTTLDNTPNSSSCSGAWCAGEASPDYVSMERKDPDVSGAMESNWANNNTYTKNGTDTGGNAINGTPKSQNSINLAPIGYYCPDEASSYTSGGYYTPTSGSCTYLSSTLSGNRYGDLYRGIVASSTLITGHLITSAISTENGDNLTNPIHGEDYFTAIYEVRTEPSYDDITDFRNYFQTGANAPPHENYGILWWKYKQPLIIFSVF